MRYLDGYNCIFVATDASWCVSRNEMIVMVFHLDSEVISRPSRIVEIKTYHLFELN